MDQSLNILVAARNKGLVSLLERAMQGRATVRQVEPLAEHVLASIGINDKPIVVIHAEKEGAEWLNLLKSLHTSCPRLKTLAFGDAVDVGPVARGIVYGLSGYVPLNLHPDLREVSKAVILAATGGAPPADTLFGRVKGMLPISQDGSFTSTSGNSLSREAAIHQCDGLGLTPAETAGFLGVSVDDAEAVAGKASRKVRGGEFAVSGRLKVMGLILIASLALFGLLGRRNEKFFVPVSGTVSLNGQPLPDVIVSFSREGGSHIASGKTDDEGKFRLSTLQQGDGAEAGTHVVWITRRSGVRDYIAMDDPKYTEKMIALREKIRTERESQDKLEETIPMSYFDKTTSSLRAEVEGRKPLNFSFDLKP
jgi:hypothetical protein